VAIAGTDAHSVADWIFEDLLVHHMVEWPYAGTANPKPKISKGVSNGLDLLLSRRSWAAFGTLGDTLITFLTKVAHEKIDLYCTGHSLGGALAPVLALALEDQRDKWDPQNNATIWPFSFAGPTAGDQAFVDYFTTRFGTRLQRIWNGLDVVPHAWDVAQLNQISGLYGTNQTVTDVVNYMIGRVGDNDYTHLNGAASAFSGGPTEPPLDPKNPITFDGFKEQAEYQHVEAYLQWGNISTWIPNPFPPPSIDPGSGATDPAAAAP
jgi:hypothetical protein